MKIYFYWRFEQGKVDFWVFIGKRNFKVTVALPVWIW